MGEEEKMTCFWGGCPAKVHTTIRYAYEQDTKIYSTEILLCRFHAYLLKRARVVGEEGTILPRILVFRLRVSEPGKGTVGEWKVEKSPFYKAIVQ